MNMLNIFDSVLVADFHVTMMYLFTKTSFLAKSQAATEFARKFCVWKL